MNDEITTDSDSQAGVLERIKESPRTVSALIIILIVAAAIYAFSGDNTPEQTAEVSDEAAVTTTETGEDEAATQGEEEGENGEVASATDGEEEDTTPAQVSEPVSQEQLTETAAGLPEAQTTDTGYMEVAQAGDGVTHLSRRAATRWLADNAAGYEVTNEHRVYIEDYIQDRIGSQQLSMGEERTISFDLIAEAVDAAGQLNQQQLQNLSQYAPALS